MTQRRTLIKKLATRAFAAGAAIALTGGSLAFVSAITSYGATAGLILQSRSWSCPVDREMVARTGGSLACAKDLTPARLAD